MLACFTAKSSMGPERNCLDFNGNVSIKYSFVSIDVKVTPT